MNDKKICFITAVNKEDQYEECLYYISKLSVPDGYEVETLAIRDASSMCEAYNAAMRSTEAKYKVYLHQDVLVRNIDFIKDILGIFSDEKIGLIGVAGGTKMPKNGICFAAFDTGFVDEREPGASFLMRPKSNTGGREVSAIDGLIMITQYDVKWREDLFKGFHYYDISQSFEFTKTGYKIYVPNQDFPWVIHNCNFANLSDYEGQAEIIIREYGEFLTAENIGGPSENFSELMSISSQLIAVTDKYISNGQWNDIVVIIERYRSIHFNDSKLEIIGLISDIFAKEQSTYGKSPFVENINNVDEALKAYQKCVYGITRVELDKPEQENTYFISRILSKEITVEAVIILLIKIVIDRKNCIKRLLEIYQNNGLNVETDRLNQIREVIMKSETTYGWMLVD